jgi:hypothetical protein
MFERKRSMKCTAGCAIGIYETETCITIRDGRHAKHRQNGPVVFYATWGAFILYNATSQF